jgi:glyoxylase-like metal-dependent hydrolase (beta-lactamase superfamily II)
VLVSGEREAILVDAQFGQREAQQVVEKIRASGKTLTTIYISHGDPDYYFGLETLHAYPEARIVAAARPCNIRESAGKLAYWGPKLGTMRPRHHHPGRDQRPQPHAGRPQAGHRRPGRRATGSQLRVDPSLKAVVGGVVVAGNIQYGWPIRKA